MAQRRDFSDWTVADVERRNAAIAARQGKPHTPPDHPPEMRMEQEQPRSKYRNVKVVVDGERFDSKREAQYWAELKLREKAGEIVNLQRQVKFDLCCRGDFDEHGKYLGDKLIAHYIADFVFHEVMLDAPHHSELSRRVQDVKGGKATRTALYRLKKKWLELQSGIIVEEID